MLLEIHFNEHNHLAPNIATYCKTPWGNAKGKLVNTITITCYDFSTVNTADYLYFNGLPAGNRQAELTHRFANIFLKVFTCADHFTEITKIIIPEFWNNFVQQFATINATQNFLFDCWVNGFITAVRGFYHRGRDITHIMSFVVLDPTRSAQLYTKITNDAMWLLLYFPISLV